MSSRRAASGRCTMPSWWAIRLRNWCSRSTGSSTVFRAGLGACGKTPARSGHRVVLYWRASRKRQNPKLSSAMIFPRGRARAAPPCALLRLDDVAAGLDAERDRCVGAPLRDRRGMPGLQAAPSRVGGMYLDYVAELEEIQNGRQTGLTYGLPDLDAVTSGMRPGQGDRRQIQTADTAPRPTSKPHASANSPAAPTRSWPPGDSPTTNRSHPHPADASRRTPP